MPPRKATPEKPPADADGVEARLRAVERLIHVFRFERYVYLVAMLLSCVALVVSAIYMFVRSDLAGKRDLWALLFVPPTGAIVYASGQFLKMWSQAVKVIDGGGDR